MRALLTRIAAWLDRPEPPRCSAVDYEMGWPTQAVAGFGHIGACPIHGDTAADADAAMEAEHA